MNRMQPNCNTYRGGLIVSKEKNKGAMAKLSCETLHEDLHK